LLTFKEYLEDYASLDTRKIGEERIQAHMQEILNPSLRRETESRLREIEGGKRDLFF
jgi:2-iminoacetate synthase